MSGERHIGQYRIIRTLGAGGMGTVFLGEHILLGRRAAVKTLLPALSSHRDIVERFFIEARAISTLSDPGVVQIFDFGYHVDGTAYIVMEYLEGESLAARIDRLGKLPLAEALRISRQIAASLAAAHALGIIHRDLKPANVFVIRDAEAQGGERTKILDFGICKLAGPEAANATLTGTMLGTPVYMSPEQCRGSGDVDQRSDIYSVGCALFHMLTGRPPFDCDNVGDFIAAHLKEDPPSPSQIAPELTPEVDALVLRCIAKRPEDRFQSMRDLQRALEDLLATLSDPGRLEIDVAVSSTPLGDGFQSAYDVNREHESGPHGHDRSSQAWFVDSVTPVASEDDDAWSRPERGLSIAQRSALILALFIGLVAGLVATSAYLENDDDEVIAAPSPLVPPSPERFGPAVATTREQAPPEVVAGSAEPADEPDARGPGAVPAAPPATFTQDAPVTKPKPARPRPARSWRPTPRRPSPPPQHEDLYDTR